MQWLEPLFQLLYTTSDRETCMQKLCDEAEIAVAQWEITLKHRERDLRKLQEDSRFQGVRT